MRLLTIGLLAFLLGLGGNTATATVPQPPTKAPTTGAEYQLHDTDVSEPPLTAACGTSASTISRQRWVLPGEGAYTARAVVTGHGWLSFSAGPSAVTVPTPCNPCVLTVPAGPVGAYMQYSLSLGALACPADTLILTAWQVSAGP